MSVFKLHPVQLPVEPPLISQTLLPVFRWSGSETSRSGAAVLTTLPPGVSVSALPRSQRCGRNLHGPFLKGVLLTTVEESARAIATQPEKYSWTSISLCCCLSSRNTGAFHLLQFQNRHHQPRQNSNNPFVYAVRTLDYKTSLQLSRVRFFSEMGGYELTAISPTQLNYKAILP